MIEKGPGVDGITEVHGAASLALQHAAEIIRKLSGSSHQRDIDYITELSDKITKPSWVNERQCLRTEEIG